MSKYQCVALLPMKTHSARVSGKNFKEFAGKPLFRWILDTLLAIDSIDTVVINTDAREILKEHGLSDSDRVILRDRRPDICGDFVSMNKVIEDDLQNIDANTYLMTHTTNPLLSADTIANALTAYQNSFANGRVDSLFSVNTFQTRFYRKDGSAVNHDPNNLLRTQDLEPWYEENSNLYIFSKESFTATSARIGRKPLLFETPRMESFDIDDQEGWDHCELVARSQRDR